MQNAFASKSEAWQEHELADERRRFVGARPSLIHVYAHRPQMDLAIFRDDYDLKTFTNVKVLYQNDDDDDGLQHEFYLSVPANQWPPLTKPPDLEFAIVRSRTRVLQYLHSLGYRRQADLDVLDFCEKAWLAFERRAREIDAPFTRSADKCSS